MEILLVEDDNNISEIISEFLMSENLSVHLAVDGDTAMDIFKKIHLI